MTKGIEIFLKAITPCLPAIKTADPKNYNILESACKALTQQAEKNRPPPPVYAPNKPIEYGNPNVITDRKIINAARKDENKEGEPSHKKHTEGTVPGDATG